MGFILNNDSDNTVFVAKLTPEGKKRIITKGFDGLVTKFGLGDSDANYNTNDILPDGYVPMVKSFHNSKINHVVNFSSSSQFKVMENNDVYKHSNYNYGSFELISENIKDDLIIVNRSENDYKTNLLATFSLPISESDVEKFTSGIYSKSIYGKLYKDRYVIIPIDSSDDMIDGLNPKIKLTIGGDIFEIRSSYSEGVMNPDSTMFDDNKLFNRIMLNSVLLFSDQIKTPINGDTWTKGDEFEKPYKNGKVKYSPFSEEVFNDYGDQPVGFFVLDQKFIVLFDDTIIDAIDDSDDVFIEVSANTINFDIHYEYTCHVNRTEFINSTNPTYIVGEKIRVTEIGLFDDYDNLVAIAKPSQPIILNRSTPKSFQVVLNI